MSLLRRSLMVAQNTGPDYVIPEGYTEVQWIENTLSSTNAGVDTGYKFNACGTVEVKFRKTQTALSAAQISTVFGTVSVDTSDYIRLQSFYNNDGSGGYTSKAQIGSVFSGLSSANEINRVLIEPNDFVDHTFKLEKYCRVWWDNHIFFERDYVDYSTEETEYNVCVFTAKVTAYSNSFLGRIYYFKMWDQNNVLKCHYVPCVRDNDDVAGFWDVVSETFITSPTSGAWTAGDPV